MRLKQLLGVLMPLLLCGLVAAAAVPQLTNVSVVGQGNTTTVTLRATGAFTHNEYRPAENLLLIDLPGISAGKLHDRERMLDVPGVKSYRVVGYNGAGGIEIARLELRLAPGAEVKVNEAKDAIAILVTMPGGEQPTVPAAPAHATAPDSNAASPVKTAAPQVTSAIAAPRHIAETNSAVASPNVAQVQHIWVSRSKDGLNVEIAANAPISGNALKLTGPDRIVIDLPNAVPTRRQHQITVNEGDVKGVRMARFQLDPPVTRVVVDLAAPHDYEVVGSGNKLVLKLKTVALAQIAPAAQPVLSANSAASKPQLVESAKVAPVKAAEVRAVEQPKPQAVVLAANSAPATPAAPAVAPGPAAAQASQESKGAADAKDFVVVQPAYSAKAQEQQQPAPTAPAPVPSATAPTPATSSPTQQPVNFAAEQRAQQQQPAGQAKARYTGEPISVNLKDVDLKDFFRLIHEISGLNIVLDPSVNGSLTLVLDDVPWDQALDIVLKNNGLDRQLDGNVLRIATIDNFRREAEAKRRQMEAQALAVEKVNITRFLSYAHSKDVLPTVKKMLSVRGDVVADERTNALIIQDIPSVIPEIDRLLAQLDRKTQEVEIEARVVAATRDFARQIGTQLGFGWGNAASAIGGTNQSGVGNSPISVSPAVTPNPLYFYDPKTGSIPLFTNLGLTGPTSGLSLANFSNNYRIDFMLTMAESRGLLKILSRPRVITQNNIQAIVRQGMRVPVVTQAQLGGPPTVTYIDAFLRLTVTPQITAENTIFMNIDVENTSPDWSHTVYQNPTLLTQQATTQVLVTDGGTVVIGGVIQTTNSVNTAQVPLLGDVPILGNLFKRRTVTSTTQELLFVVTPKIIQT
jgi:type IV pilus assembly protein PilQ